MPKNYSEMLPSQARVALMTAAAIDPSTPRTESQERTSALDRVIREIKAKYPQFFQKGK